MPQLKSEGLVLKSVNWKENSRIVTFFTDNTGRQSIIDRGGRSLKSKRGRLLTFTRLELNYFRSDKTQLGYISEVEPLEAFEFQKDGTLGRLTFGSAALELLYDLLPENEPQPELYHLTIQFLRMTDRVPKGSLFPLFLAFFIRLLSYLGYRPNFSGCVRCGRALNEDDEDTDNNGSIGFSPELGGLVCSSCQIPGEYYIKLQSERLARIYRLQTSSLAEAAGMGLKFSEAEDILELLKGFLKYQTDTRELNSLKFLDKLKKANL